MKNSPANPDTAAASEKRSALNARARSGTAWIVLAFGSGQVVRLGINIILARLLSEEVFALMAIVTAVMVGLAMFSDLGLQQNVIQSPRGDEPDFLNTAWTLQVIRGVVLTLVAALLAWPMAAFYGANDPAALELRWLIPLVSLTALMEGLRSPRILSAARHMRVGQTTRLEIAVTVVHTTILLTLAWFMRSVYALAIAGVVSTALHATLTYWFLPGERARFTLEPTAVRSIFSFGKWIFLSTLLTFLAIQIDRLAFSALYPLVEVGVYSIAASLALMIPTLIGSLQSAVIFPWYARMLEEGVGLADAFEKAKRPVMVVSTFVVVVLIVGAKSFFALAYDTRYAQAALYLPVLALSAWFNNLGSLYGSAFLVKGLSKWLAFASATKVVSFLVFLWLLSLFEGSMLSATFVVLMSEVVTTVVSRYLGWKLGLKRLGIETTMFAMLVVTSAIALLPLYLFEPVENMHPALQLLVLGALTTLLFAPLLVKELLPLFKRRSVGLAAASTG
ncbi:MAG: oligosaccharide flippase family protein [Hydrogenophaga sp.]|nr:oligosaccharide flippase family protein [Hydrogenophaga sp.]